MRLAVTDFVDSANEPQSTAPEPPRRNSAVSNTGSLNLNLPKPLPSWSALPQHLVAPFGSLTSLFKVLLHYPTFVTRFPKLGETGDTTSCCLHLCGKESGGLQALLVYDLVPYRFRRLGSRDGRPYRNLDAHVRAFLAGCWQQIWTGSQRKFALILDSADNETFYRRFASVY